MATDEPTGLLGVSDAEYGETPLTDDLAWLRQRIGKIVHSVNAKFGYRLIDIISPLEVPNE